MLKIKYDMITTTHFEPCSSPIVNEHYGNIVSVTADGGHLLNIRETFTGIPFTTGPSVTWPQPWAQFILENICTP